VKLNVYVIDHLNKESDNLKQYFQIFIQTKYIAVPNLFYA